jgi:hypothetical protein
VGESLPASRWWRKWRTTWLSVNKRMAALWRTERRSKVRFWLCNLGGEVWLSVRHGTAGGIRRSTSFLAVNCWKKWIRKWLQWISTPDSLPTRPRPVQLCFQLLWWNQKHSKDLWRSSDEKHRKLTKKIPLEMFEKVQNVIKTVLVLF